MKNFDARNYSVSDIIEWNERKLLNLSPDFQRRSVWPRKAKSYLIDTIMRGKPMPKILMTQELESGRNVRTVVDGQQRIRAILDYHNNDFSISRAHNTELAGSKFSSLSDEEKAGFLTYEISCDLLFTQSYSELLDIFTRINTYTLRLNAQELLNAKYLGYFKQLSFELGRDYVEYFVSSGILSKTTVARMGEAKLASDLLTFLIDGVQTNKNLEAFYKKYEDKDPDIDTLKSKFDEVMGYIGTLYPPEELKNTFFSREVMFYTLFTSIGVSRFGPKNDKITHRPKINAKLIPKWRFVLDEIDSLSHEYPSRGQQINSAPLDVREFLTASRRASTDTAQRVTRTNYLLKQVEEAIAG